MTSEQFERLVSEHSVVIDKWCHRYCNKEWQDLKQEALMKAWANREQFDMSKSFQSWVIQIAKNISIDWKRKRDRRPEIVNLYDSAFGGEDELDGMAALAVDYPSWQDGEYMDVEVLVRDSTERVRQILEKIVMGEKMEGPDRSCISKWRRKVSA